MITRLSVAFVKFRRNLLSSLEQLTRKGPNLWSCVDCLRPVCGLPLSAVTLSEAIWYLLLSPLLLKHIQPFKRKLFMDGIQLNNVKFYNSRPIWFISTQKKMYYKFMYSLLLWLLNQAIHTTILIWLNVICYSFIYVFITFMLYFYNIVYVKSH